MVKGWKFNERRTSRFRAEFFNVLNHPKFANPYGRNKTSQQRSFGRLRVRLRLCHTCMTQPLATSCLGPVGARYPTGIETNLRMERLTQRYE